MAFEKRFLAGYSVVYDFFKNYGKIFPANHFFVADIGFFVRLPPYIVGERFFQPICAARVVSKGVGFLGTELLSTGGVIDSIQDYGLGF